MSKGPGRVQRRIMDAFAQSADGYFSTSELCRIVYETEKIEKKHRVAVTRALRKLAYTALPNLWKWELPHEQTDDIWYDCNRLPLKGDGRRQVARR